MHSIEWSSNVCANPVEKQFKEIYRLLAEVRGSFQKLEDIGRAVARCYQELRSLERIHHNRWRFHNDELEDPFELRSTLQGFYNTCHSLKYITLPHDDEEFSPDVGCVLTSMPSKHVWRKKQTRAIESDLLDHERTIAAILSSLVYTTTLKISRAGEASDLDTDFILRCAERRHERYDRKQQQGKSKAHGNEPIPEETDWKESLQKYFRLMNSWKGGAVEARAKLDGSTSTTSRASSLTQSGQSRSSSLLRSVPPVTNDTRFNTYSNYRRGEEVGTDQYFRRPRRSSSGSSAVGWVPLDQAARSRLSIANTTKPSQELVIYNSSTSASSSSIVAPRPIRRSSIKGDFHWEYVGRSSTFNMLQPLTVRWPELKDAQVDIYNQTQGMSSSESRAYALGRLAGLSPEITDEVRRVLSLSPAAQTPSQGSNAISRLTRHVSTDYEPVEVRRRSMSLDTPTRRMVPQKDDATARVPNHPLSAAAPTLHKTPNTKNTKGRSIPIINASSNKRNFLSTLAERRPMTAISERSSRSALSKASMDKSSGRSLMQSLKMRKANMSQLSILETVPDKVEIGGRSSSGSDTLTSSKDLDVDERPKSAQSQDTVTTSSTMNIQTPLSSRSKRSFGPKIMAAIFGSRKSDTHLAVPTTTSALSLHSAPTMSQESLRRVSVELLKRRDSRMTMLSIGENLDIPFDIWLRALPYIEGRCNSTFESETANAILSR